MLGSGSLRKMSMVLLAESTSRHAVKAAGDRYLPALKDLALGGVRRSALG